MPYLKPTLVAPVSRPSYGLLPNANICCDDQYAKRKKSKACSRDISREQKFFQDWRSSKFWVEQDAAKNKSVDILLA